ncbi:MAG TPA: dicarboxylate/amino acid:cation symporter [Chthoniobacterales bacterium]
MIQPDSSAARPGINDLALSRNNRSTDVLGDNPAANFDALDLKRASAVSNRTGPLAWAKKGLRSLYVQVLVAIAAGCLVGWLAPEWGVAMKPLGDGFIKLVKMMIGPIIFATVVCGIGALGDLRKVGRVGLKALIYFEVLTTFALVIGLVVVNLIKPGVGIHANAAALDASSIQTYTAAAQHLTTVDFILNIIPKTFVDAFVSGEILQVLCVGILFGAALSMMGKNSTPIVSLMHHITDALMKIIGLIMKLAPFAAFGAMGFTIGKFGVGSIVQLLGLLACVYLTCLGFIFIVLAGIMRLNGFSLWKFLRYIREELLLVLGTSSSESALPRMLIKMQRMGCEKSVVGLVLPTGYSFNLDGTSIYLTMAAVFVAQATDTPLSLAQQIGLLVILLLTSKGAAAVTGGGFVTLSATLASVGTVPVAGLTLLLGIDRFMSEARAITNLIGNGVATLFIASWEKALDRDKAHAALNDPAAHELGD